MLSSVGTNISIIRHVVQLAGAGEYVDCFSAFFSSQVRFLHDIVDDPETPVNGFLGL